MRYYTRTEQGWWISLGSLVIMFIGVASCERIDTNGLYSVISPVDQALDCLGSYLVTFSTDNEHLAQLYDPPEGEGGVSSYGGDPTVWYGESPEKVFKLSTPAGRLVLHLVHDERDLLDVFLLRTCDPGSVADKSLPTTPGTEHLATQVTAGTYFVVIDGRSGSWHPSKVEFGITIMPLAELTDGP